MNTRQPGYILALTLMILALAIIITTQMFNKGMVHSVYAKTVMDREKGKQLALGGVQVALSMLALDQTTTQLQQQQQQSQEYKAVIKKIVPSLNRWSAFDLKEEREGIDAKLMVCISSEQGKININQMYDFKNKKFVGQDQPKGDMKKVMQSVFKAIKEEVGKDLFLPFEAFLKELGRPLYDVTELLAIKEFAVFKDAVFYEPPVPTESKKKRTIYLTDIFTVDSSNAQLQPWLLSDSMCALLQLKRAQAGDIKQRAEEINNLMKDVKQEYSWQTDWDKMLKPLYEKEFTSLPKDINSLLSPQFESNIFSVLTYGKVGEIEQRLYAIIQRKASDEKQHGQAYVVKKMYWL